MARASRSGSARTRVGRWAFGFCFLDGTRRGDERERDAIDLGVLGSESLVSRGKVRSLGSEGVAHPAESATDDLLAEKLGAKRADAKDVGNGVRVPPFGEHGDGDDAADALAELARLTDGVEDFAEKIFGGDGVGITAWEAPHVFGLEFGDLLRGGEAEVVGHCIARVDLHGVDEEGLRLLRPSPSSVIVAEEVELACLDTFQAVEVFLPSGDEVEDHLGYVGVVADDDKDGRGQTTSAGVGVTLPSFESLFVVEIERL